MQARPPAASHLGHHGRTLAPRQRATLALLWATLGLANGTIEPAGLLTRQAPLIGALEAYREFDRRSPGWVKVELQPQTH